MNHTFKMLLKLNAWLVKIIRLHHCLNGYTKKYANDHGVAWF